MQHRVTPSNFVGHWSIVGHCLAWSNILCSFVGPLQYHDFFFCVVHVNLYSVMGPLYCAVEPVQQYGTLVLFIYSYKLFCSFMGPLHSFIGFAVYPISIKGAGIAPVCSTACYKGWVIGAVQEKRIAISVICLVVNIKSLVCMYIWVSFSCFGVSGVLFCPNEGCTPAWCFSIPGSFIGCLVASSKTYWPVPSDILPEWRSSSVVFYLIVLFSNLGLSSLGVCKGRTTLLWGASPQRHGTCP